MFVTKYHQHHRDERDPARSQGFTLIELLVVITIIALLASVMLVLLNVARARARDARRLADMSEIQKALQFYYDAHNEYPPVTYTDGYNLAGWEVSYRPDFMEYLAPFLSGVPVDPINAGPPTDNGTSPYGAMFNTPRPDGTFFYMYFGNYPSGEFYGCPWKGSFGVIGFRALETGDAFKLPHAHCGPQPCDGGGVVGVCRDWYNEFDYSTFLTQ